MSLRSTETFLVVVSHAPRRWSVVRSVGDQVEMRTIEPDGADAEASSASQATRVAEVLTELGYSGQGVCLGLGTDLVMNARIDCENLPRRDRALAMLYRLEEQLPLEAEELTAEFLPPSGGSALGIAVRTRVVGEIVDTLDEAGVQVAAICPVALLALWQLMRDKATDSPYVILSATGQAGVDIFRMHDGRPQAWYYATGGADDVATCLQADLLTGSLQENTPGVAVVGSLSDGQAAQDKQGEIARQTGLTIENCDARGPIELAICAAESALAGRGAGWVDLRCGDLAPTGTFRQLGAPMKLAIILGIILIASLAALFQWRAVSFEKMARSRSQQQRHQYMQLFPGRPTPVSARSALASEFKRIAGVRGADTGVPRQVNGLERLKTVISSLPASIRLRIGEVRIAPESILIEGQARDHIGAEVICKSLRRAGLDMDPPRSERLVRGGVAFTLTGRPSSSKQLASAADQGGQR